MGRVPVEPSARPRQTIPPTDKDHDHHVVRPTVATTAVLIAHPEPSSRLDLLSILDSAPRVRVVALTGDAAATVAVARCLRPQVILFDDRLAGPAPGDIMPTLAAGSRVIVMTARTDPEAITTLLRGPVRGCLVYDNFEPGDLLGAVYAVAGGHGWLSPVAASVAASALRGAADPGPTRADGTGRGPARLDPAGRGSAGVEASRTRAARQGTARRGQDGWDPRLTSRERDVLAMLRRGLSNAAIAAELTLTEKTVKNHLHRIFVKLGVRSRIEAVLLVADGDR